MVGRTPGISSGGLTHHLTSEDRLSRPARRPDDLSTMLRRLRSDAVFSPALHCFTIFDDRAVIVGTETATAIITDPDDIADYDQRHAFYAQIHRRRRRGPRTARQARR